MSNYKEKQNMIVNYDGLNEKEEFVKEYLDECLKKRRSSKHPHFYTALVKIYDKYPHLIEQVLQTLFNTGYWKDYTLLLMQSHNEALNNRIYTIMVTQVKKDLQNTSSGSGVPPLSTIGKWLPREGSKIDNKTNFINNFMMHYDSEVTGYGKKKIYRQIKTFLDKKLNILEPLLCTREYAKIDFDRISRNSKRKCKALSEKNVDMRKEFIEYNVKKFTSLNLYSFINKLASLKEDYLISAVDEVWKRECNKYNNLLLCQYDAVIIDLSSNVVNSNKLGKSIGIAILNSVNCGGRIIIANKNPVLIKEQDFAKLNIVEKRNKLMVHCGPCNVIDVEKCMKGIQGINNRVLVITTESNRVIKNINNIKCSIMFI